MTPTTFPESNVIFRNPEDMTPEQVLAIPAYTGQIVGGNCDGQKVVIVAWKPEANDIARILQGAPIYMMVFEGLPPHSLSTTFPLK